MLQRKDIPNLLTVLRLVLAGVFFAVLASYRYDVGDPGGAALLLPAVLLFIAAALTDALDGYYARKWQAESKFGRIMDPFCDKVLVIGAFVFLAGPGFAAGSGEQASGIYPWMAVLVIARELLVTGIRGEMEGSGHQFGANLWGKLKMVLQSVAVPAVLLIVLIQDHRQDAALAWLGPVRDVLVYATVLATVLSGLPYVTGAVRIVRQGRDTGDDRPS